LVHLLAMAISRSGYLDEERNDWDLSACIIPHRYNLSL